MPSNIAVFAWKVVIDRVQSKSNLRRRNIISSGGDINCLLCNGAEESTNHLFFECPAAVQVWNRCLRWLGVVSAMPVTGKDHLLQFGSVAMSGSQNLLWKVVWCAVLWTIWNSRNGIVFRNGEFDADKVFELIKIRSWSWLSAKVHGFCSSLFEWSNCRCCVWNMCELVAVWVWSCAGMWEGIQELGLRGWIAWSMSWQQCIRCLSWYLFLLWW